MWCFQSRFRPLIPHQHSTMPRSRFRMVQIQTGDVIQLLFFIPLPERDLKILSLTDPAYKRFLFRLPTMEFSFSILLQPAPILS